MNTGQAISVEGLTKDFLSRGNRLPVLNQIDLHADHGEFVTIVGPSGCGKSTLMNIMAGLDTQTSGTVLLQGEVSDDRLGRVGYMHQKDLLLPWRSVIDNAVLGLEVLGFGGARAKEKAQYLMDLFGLAGFENEYPHALSGGMRQRAAFLRTVLTDQDVFLLDEPFGALDALSRSKMQEWLLSLWESMNKTIVLVTHDVDEAIFLSDRVYVMGPRPGRIRLVESVDLPRPRRFEMVTGSDFVGLKKRLLDSIREEAVSK